MSHCEKYKKQLVLYVYDELEDLERSELEAHLHICTHCKNELLELKSLQEIIPQKPLVDPDEPILQLMRNILSQKIRSRTVVPNHRNKRFRFFSFVNPSPAFQVSFVIFLLLFGVLLGRQTAHFGSATQTSFEKLLAANQQIQTANGEINPLLAGVEKVNYNSQTGEVEIYYTTVNDIQLYGDLDSPAIRDVLQHAMLQEDNPSVRLHAVKALQVLAEEKKTVEPEFIGVIETLMNKENNLGVRLQTVKLLQVLPFNDAVKNILTKILLHDREPSMRMQAFDKLTSEPVAGEELAEYVAIAKKDTNEYLKYRSDAILNQLQMKEKITEDTKTVKIMRKEKP